MKRLVCCLLLAAAVVIGGGRCRANNNEVGVRVIVIDAGHGGKAFPGATYGGVKEKDINLAVALKLGALIEKELPQIKVVYTRKTDTALGKTLNEDLTARANIANKAGGDFFISIHANAVPGKPSVAGAETIIMGESENEPTFFAKLADSFYKTFIRESRWELFVQGAGLTILITLSSIIAGTILGFLVYILCRKGGKIANSITNFFLWLIHGMPTVLLLMILYYIVFGSSRLSGTWVSVVGFSLMFACSMIDMLRVGCNAIGKGQTEASRALGYSEGQSFFRIILPQAAQHFLPIYRNEVVTLIKETSVVGYIAVLDLTKISDLVRSRTYEAFFPLIVTAIMYFVISAVLTKLVSLVEHAIDPKRRKKDKILRGIKEEE